MEHLAVVVPESREVPLVVVSVYAAAALIISSNPSSCTKREMFMCFE